MIFINLVVKKKGRAEVGGGRWGFNNFLLLKRSGLLEKGAYLREGSLIGDLRYMHIHVN